MTKASLGIGIMAVPSRRLRVQQLIEKLGVPEEAVSWDKEHQGHIYNWWKAVEAAWANQPTHCLIVEDDAEPCLDFIPAVEKLIGLYPNRIISFFTRTKVTEEAPAGSLVRVKDVPTDIAVVFPIGWLRNLRKDFLLKAETFARRKRRFGYGADEMRAELRPDDVVWTTVPSLVEHGCPNKSTLNRSYPTNVAKRYIGNDTSALSIDWGAGIE